MSIESTLHCVHAHGTLLKPDMLWVPFVNWCNYRGDLYDIKSHTLAHVILRLVSSQHKVTMLLDMYMCSC